MWSRTEVNTCCICFSLCGQSLPRKKQRPHRTRQVLYRTTVYVSLCYLVLWSGKVNTVIPSHASGTSQGSCNLAEPMAEGRQWLGGGGGIQLLQGLMAPNRKHQHAAYKITLQGSRRRVLRAASWLSLSSMTTSEVICVYCSELWLKDRKRQKRGAVVWELKEEELTHHCLLFLHTFLCIISCYLIIKSIFYLLAALIVWL